MTDGLMTVCAHSSINASKINVQYSAYYVRGKKLDNEFLSHISTNWLH